MKKHSLKNKARKTACVLTAGMMLFSVGALTACGNKTDSNNTALVDTQEAQKALSYKVTEIPIQGLENFYGQITVKNGLYYLVQNDYEIIDDMYYSSYSVRVFDETGAEKLTIPVFKQTDTETYGGINGDLYVDDSGNISCMVYESSYNETTGEYKEIYNLVTYDSAGNETKRQELGQIYTQEDMENEMYFNGYIVDAQGNLYLNLNKVIRVCDSTGNKLFDTPASESENSWMSNLILTNTGTPAVLVYDYTNDISTQTLKEIDINAKGYGKEHVLTAVNGTLYSGSGDYLCYMSSETGISGIRADNTQTENVVNLLTIGIDNSNISSFVICDDGSFITVGNNYTHSGSTTTVSKILPVESSEVAQKEIITLGCFYLDWNIRSEIAEFNKTSDKYTIFATSFSETNDTSDWEAALTKFNNELLAGNVPDLILLNSGMPVNSYASKGLFADLYELMDKDAELTRDKFTPNVLSAFETNGKLYEITPAYSVQTLAAKTSLVGTEQSITLDKALGLVADMGEGATLFGYDIAAPEFLSTAISFSDFVDYENGTCNFDSPEFKAVLEYAKTLPKEIDYETMYNENPNYWVDKESACRNNKALFYSMYFSDFTSYTQTRDGNFGEDITLTGFPTSNPESTGAAMFAQTEMAISSKSEHKDGAWEFIKYVINGAVTEEPYYIWDNSTNEQKDTGRTRYNSKYYSLPVLKDQLDKLAQQALVADTYIDENGNEVEQENMWYIGGEEIKVGRPTQADIDMLKEYFANVDKVSRQDMSIDEIVNEEFGLFYDGQKTVDETVSVIQSRASIYMSEQY